jgi:hypothetical protein
MKKKILVVCKSFYPTNGPRANRATELVKEFARLGHEVTVITPRLPIHDKFEELHGVIIKDLGTTFFHKSNHLLFKKVLMKLLIILGIAEKYNLPDFLFMNKLPKLLKNCKVDLLISIAKPHSIHWGVAKSFEVNSNLAIKWVADCGDPFMGNPFHNYSKYFEKYERLFCEKADYITVPIKEAIPSYFPEFSKKIKVIPQGFNFTEDRKFLSTYTKNNIPTFAYAGAFYKNNRDPRKLFEYLVNLNMDYKFIIYTSNVDLVVPYLEKAKGRFIIRSYVPRHELLSELSKMDFLININNISSVQSPSKLIDYYLTGRPVLSLNNNSVNQTLDEFLRYDFSNSYLFENMHLFDIHNVAESFLSL